jgi:arylsulfatase A-like enzyme
MSFAFGGVLRRVVAATAGTVAASVLASAFDAKSASSASGASFGSAWLTALGITLPYAVALGIGAGAVLAVGVSDAVRARMKSWLAPDDAKLRRERAWLLALAPAALLVWLLFAAGTALGALVSESAAPLAAGVSLGLSWVGLALSVSVLAASRVLSGRAVSLPSPLKTGALSLAIFALVLLAIVASGEPSGAGGPLSLFGVLTRDELDLRPVGLLVLLALGALLAPAPRSRTALGVFAATALVPPPLLLGLAERELGEPELSLAIERSAPLSGKLLGPLRRSTDRDRDGHAAHFGGGDCDDRDPSRNPGADDVPGNRLDEDCSGADAALVTPRAPAPAALPDVADLRKNLPERLNVVLITIDTLRYDLGYLGATRPISPRLDELARESVVFERAYALASYTSKSLPPMLIGKYCAETHRGFAHFNRFEKSDVFLAERLARAGVDTLSVQGHWYFFQNYGMERGFRVIDSSAQPKAAQAEGDRTSTSDALSSAAISQLAKLDPAAKPFFLWVHYTDPHAEYAPHEGFDFGSDSRARYDGEVAFVDHHVGRLFDTLRKGTAWDRTAVIVTSDHGEAFGEHGMIRHGFELWEELVRVPLLVRVPGVAPRRIQTRRSLIDLVPTVLDLFRIPQPEGADALSGQSLVSDFTAKDGRPPPARPILVDMPQGPHNAERSAFIDQDLKLITSGGRPLGLYDLAEDPGEKTNLLRDRDRTRAALDNYKGFRRGLREIHVRPTP